MSLRVAVIGGGPAGLMAAIKAADGGAKVMLFERMARPGMKLAVTGGGRGNFTNVLGADEMAKWGFLGNWRFVVPALKSFTPEDLRKWFSLQGIPSDAADGFHYFPKSEKAMDLVQALLMECQTKGIEIVCNAQVGALQIVDKVCTGIEVNGKYVDFDRVILAGGGKSYPKLGSDGNAYTLAQQAEHSIIPVVPALGALRVREEWVKRLSGIVFAEAALGVSEKTFEPGGVLFTHEGISGPAVLDWCGRINRMRLKGSDPTVFFRLNSQRDLAFYQNDFAEARGKNGASSIKKYLIRFIPQSLAYELLSLCQLDSKVKLAEVPGSKRDLLLGLMDKIALNATGSDGFERAATCDGGVCTDEINPKTLESKKTKGLFFAGEVLDVNARCGGYHLQWAFSSGALAGDCASVTA